MPIIKIVPSKAQKLTKKSRLMSFVGISEGCWGDTTQDVNNSIQNLRDSWSRKDKLSLEKILFSRKP